ncbi:hypothetical protein QYE76_020469 [Lolium multiflorum]|uniref:Uncharacterized protein n=1 Tax=Lolium multiflorum TaxID=4521 RepID=A0AAD8R739_LOLMU|nr:hypothetical protein QYE76_020469 [Lolium multiflorum]
MAMKSPREMNPLGRVPEVISESPEMGFAAAASLEGIINKVAWNIRNYRYVGDVSVQRLRNLEEAEAQYLYTLRKARPDLAVKIQQTLETKARPPKKVWRPKQTKADAQASADADAEASADTNMVSVIPTE